MNKQIKEAIGVYVRAEIDSGEGKGKRKHINIPLFYDNEYFILEVYRLWWDINKNGGVWNCKKVTINPTTEDRYYDLCRSLTKYVKEDHS